MKIVSVVGARPQFVKLFPITRAIPTGVTHQIIHTGQHYDESMSQVFFDELQIPRPVINLDVGSGTHAQQTAAMMIGLEKSFLETKPDIVLVYGDTNSTIAASLVASKMNIAVAHLEAGLRSFNRSMPEELNRITTDHLSSLLLAPSETAMKNLSREGLAHISTNIGDVMVDSTLLAKSLIKDFNSEFSLTETDYIFCTIHRAENTDDPDLLSQILTNISKSPIQIIFAAHPRVLEKCRVAQIDLVKLGIKVISPQSYLSTIKLVSGASGVVTDSGGLQKEAYLLGIPTLTIRSQTEWTETLAGDWNYLDPLGELVSQDWINRPRGEKSSFLGDGRAANRAVNSILNFLSQ